MKKNLTRDIYPDIRPKVEKEMIGKMIELLVEKGELSEAEGIKAKYIVNNDIRWRG